MARGNRHVAAARALRGVEDAVTISWRLLRHSVPRNDNFSRRGKFASFGGTLPSLDGVKNLSGSADIPEWPVHSFRAQIMRL